MTPGVRVARIITRLNVGGPAVQALTLSSRLARHGFETLLLHGCPEPNEGDMRALLQADSVRSQNIRSLRRPVRPLNDLRALAEVYSALCRFQPAIVHTHTAKAGTIGRLATVAYNQTIGRRHPARVVHTYHGHVFDGYFRPGLAATFAAMERRLARATDAIVAISPRIREEIVQKYQIGRPEQVRVVPLGFDLSRFLAIDDRLRAKARFDLGLASDIPVVTTVGRLTAIKRQDLFLNMAARVRVLMPETAFLIVGDGALRFALERQAQALGLMDHVRFLGWRGDLPTIYAATDVFALTSDNEGTPVALIEALASAVACVSTEVGGVRDVVDAESGTVVRAGDAEAMAEAVCVLLKRPDTRSRLGETGRRSAAERFGLARLETNISALYRQIL
jgi:glycosyltransferase involved in cell wall biosynthesis